MIISVKNLLARKNSLRSLVEKSFSTNIYQEEYLAEFDKIQDNEELFVFLLTKGYAGSCLPRLREWGELFVPEIEKLTEEEVENFLVFVIEKRLIGKSQYSDQFKELVDAIKNKTLSSLNKIFMPSHVRVMFESIENLRMYSKCSSLRSVIEYSSYEDFTYSGWLIDTISPDEEAILATGKDLYQYLINKFI